MVEMEEMTLQLVLKLMVVVVMVLNSCCILELVLLIPTNVYPSCYNAQRLENTKDIIYQKVFHHYGYPLISIVINF